MKMSIIIRQSYLMKFSAYLAPKPGQSIVDATLGGGGYTSAILKKVGTTGKVLAIDLDKDAIENFKSQISPTPSANADTPPQQGGGGSAVDLGAGKLCAY